MEMTNATTKKTPPAGTQEASSSDPAAVAAFVVGGSGREDPLLPPALAPSSVVVVDHSLPPPSPPPLSSPRGCGCGGGVGGVRLRYKLARWVLESAWPGMGLFGESYLLFSVGTLRPLWSVVYPDCFDFGGGDGDDDGDDGGGGGGGGSSCPRGWIDGLSYSVVLGVITGMIVIGGLADRVGRRRGSVLTASLMSVGSAGLTSSSLLLSSNPRALFASLSALLFLFGVGVGGEYPLSASSASERAMGTLKRKVASEMAREEKRRDDPDALSVASTPTRSGNSRKVVTPAVTETDVEVTNDKGKRVLLVFAMQGVGILVNGASLALLLLVFGQTGDDGTVESHHGKYDPDALLAVWRSVYAIGTAILFAVWIGRVKYLEESRVWLDDKRRRAGGGDGGDDDDDGNANMGGGREDAKGGFVPPTPAPPTPAAESERRRRRLREGERPAAAAPAAAAASSSPGPPLSSRRQRRRTTTPPPSRKPSDVGILEATSTMSSVSDDDVDDDDDDVVVRRAVEGALVRPTPSTTASEDLDATTTRLLTRNFGWRLFGTSTSWLLWDVAFYGNKLFQSTFLIALCGEETTLLELAGAATLNAFVALLGYFAAAFVVDDPRVGRLRLQRYGFLLTGSLFVMCGLLRDGISSGWLVVFYLGSSFFGQCGPNATTFLIPAEIFPTEARTLCHGISASAGKAGALIAAILFNYASEPDLFLISGYASFAASAVTHVFVPETTTLDLYEIDKKWRMTREGRKAEYVGPADDPEHLSFYERSKMGLGY